jgi:hypothetical protein
MVIWLATQNAKPHVGRNRNLLHANNVKPGISQLGNHFNTVGLRSYIVNHMG